MPSSDTPPGWTKDEDGNLRPPSVGPTPPPGWTRDEDGGLRPPSIGPSPGKAGGKKKGKGSAISRNRLALSEEDERLAQQLSSIMGVSIEEARAQIQADPTAEGEDPLEAALTQAALEVSGVNLFNYGGDQQLPGWVPSSIREYVATNPTGMTGAYDPYHGLLSQEGDERVYMGTERVEPKTPKGGMTPDGMTPAEARAAGLDHNDFPKKRKRDKTLTYQQAQNLPYTWEDEEIAEAMKKFRESGINVRNFDELVGAWGSLVDRASKTYALSLGKKKVSPWDVLELNRREVESAGLLVDYEGGSQTRTATSVSEISEGESWATLRTTLSSLLGRDPSDQEVRDYAYRMNTLAAKNPSITETITRYQAGDVVGTQSTTTGGFDADDMAREAYDQAQNDPEYAKIQAGTTYFNALMGALGAIGD